MTATWTCGTCSTTNTAADAQCVVCRVERGSAGATTAAGPAAASTPAATPLTPLPPPLPPGAIPAGQGGVPPIPPPAAAPPMPPLLPATPPPKRRGLIVALAAAIVLLLGIGAAIVVVATQGDGGSSGDTQRYDAEISPTADTSVETGDAAADAGVEDDLTTSEPLADPSTSVPGPLTRSASLHATFAKMRTEPRLSSGVARELPTEGMAIEVLAEATTDGWYQVRVEGVDGYLFGAFVSPPSPGFCVGTSVGPKPYVSDGFGNPVGGELSGNKVLMTASTPDGDRWPVVMPEGQTGYVSVDDVSVESCG